MPVEYSPKFITAYWEINFMSTVLGGVMMWAYFVERRLGHLAAVEPTMSLLF